MREGWAHAMDLHRIGAVGLCFLSMACSQAKRDDVPPNCDVLDRYEFASIMGTVGSVNVFFGAADGTPAPPKITPEQARQLDAGTTYSVSVDKNGVERVFNSTTYTAETLDPDVCGATLGVVFATSGNQNWGSFVSNYQALSPTERNATGYDGISFWAMSEFDRGHQLSFTDMYSDSKPVTALTPESGETYDTYRKCQPKILDDELGNDLPGPQLNPKYYDENGVQTPEACDNEYSVELLTTGRWAFYTIPFTHLTQTPDPRLRADGIDRSSIYRVRIRALKDSTVRTHFTDFAWYRSKSP